MTTDDSSKVSSSSSVTAGRSLLSRLTLPLRSRTRNFTDFYIRAVEPHRQYAEGETIQGLVVLTVVKPIRITHLTVALHGFVRVFKSSNNSSTSLESAGHETGLIESGTRRRTQHFGNGSASLFQDEAILCGEGRLEIGVYEFEFDLQFPESGLPTSVDFERGTISYVIRATLTRPTSIAAVSTCDRKVAFLQTIDVGTMAAPKPRVICLEPINKRGKKSTRTKIKTDNVPIHSESSTLGEQSSTGRAESPFPDESASQIGSADRAGSPQSNGNREELSEVSEESVVSSSTGASFRVNSVPATYQVINDDHRHHNSTPTAGQTITASIELLKAGCLPGDNVSMKISIQHTKCIRSMHGIIITLYRQGRIDSAPPFSMSDDLSDKAAQKLKHEEYYPKSKTGLGGLSLSSVGSSNVFRKDLAQTFAPIIIDPATLSTVVSASIRVPDDVFPTINNTPGQMITFRYQIEVVLDLGGKLAGQERHLPRLGMIDAPLKMEPAPSPSVARINGGGNMVATWGSSIIETEHIRRQKGVVACLFEVIVGTSDSVRTRNKGKSVSRPRSSERDAMPYKSSPDQVTSTGGARSDQSSANPRSSHPNSSNNSIQHNSSEVGFSTPSASRSMVSGGRQSEEHSQQSVVPLSDISLDPELTEKDRLRAAEARLLPSQPPGHDLNHDSSASAPSAPSYLDEAAPGYQRVQDNPSSSVLRSTDFGTAFHGSTSAPFVDDPADRPTRVDEDDKQELERRRLMAEASSPSDFVDDQEASSTRRVVSAHQPTAPVLSEDERYGSDFAHQQVQRSNHQHDLPEYVR